MTNLNKFSMGYDEELARQADPQSSYIKESGIYDGKITKCIVSEARNSDAWALEFSFVTTDGEQANFLSLWQANRNGEQFFTDQKGNPRPLPGVSIAQSIMGICGVKQLHPVQGKEAIGFKEFTNKEIALGLQKEHYTKSDGTDGYKFNIVRAFKPVTHQTLSEYRDNKEAQFCKVAIEDKDSRTGAGQPQAGSYASQSQPTSEGVKALFNLK